MALPLATAVDNILTQANCYQACRDLFAPMLFLMLPEIVSATGAVRCAYIASTNKLSEANAGYLWCALVLLLFFKV
jgi:hypothetical protein